jgi:hypothetical protein
MIAIAMIIGGLISIWIGRSLPKEMIVSPILFMIVWDILAVSILKDYSQNVALQVLIATIIKVILFVVLIKTDTK